MERIVEYFVRLAKSYFLLIVVFLIVLPVGVNLYYASEKQRTQVTFIVSLANGIEMVPGFLYKDFYHSRFAEKYISEAKISDEENDAFLRRQMFSRKYRISANKISNGAHFLKFFFWIDAKEVDEFIQFFSDDFLFYFSSFVNQKYTYLQQLARSKSADEREKIIESIKALEETDELEKVVATSDHEVLIPYVVSSNITPIHTYDSKKALGVCLFFLLSLITLILCLELLKNEDEQS